MANPGLIQKQIKDNTEDLHNFVRDLKLWEEEMKRKDRHLSNDNSEETLPPVRRAKKSDKSLDKKPVVNKNKRILSHDYKAWANFDVDKACEEIDKDDITTDGEEESNEENTLQEEKYMREKASYEKEMGNRHVKACKWDEAIEAYTKAITAYPKDPIFFANRALCYLKISKFDASEVDCTESLKLDPTYVKAYLRRAAVHEALHRPEAAAHDLRRALQLEPHNTQAQQLLHKLTSLAQVNNGKQKVKDSVTKDETNAKNECIPINKESEISLNSQPPKLGQHTIDQSFPEVKINKNEGSNVSDEPDWKPCSNTVEPISKPPHLRSKKSLKRVEIYDVGFNCPEHVCARKSSVSQVSPVRIQPSVSAAVEPSGGKSRSILTINTSVTKTCVSSPPKTAVQFHTAWSAIRGDKNLCSQYLQQIPGENLSEIFKESLESHVFSEIIQTLTWNVMNDRTKVSLLPYLQGLSAVRRFSTLVLFMSPKDKSNLTKLLEYCRNTNQCSDEDMNKLKRLYEII